jgi:predicted P-loop ATPase
MGSRDHGEARGLGVSDGFEWKEKLVVNKSGKPEAVVENARVALRECPQWAEVLCFNESTLATMAKIRPPFHPEKRTVPFAWTDNDDVLTAAWLQRHGILATPRTAGQAVQAVARERVFHPIRDYLNSLKWDGEPRLDCWLATYLGAEGSSYTAAVGACWLISGAARIFLPVSKVDTILILEGPQGSKKSTALRTLGAPWFTDSMPDLGNKDSALQLCGMWIVELSELDSLARSEATRVKAFASRDVDRYRPPYGSRSIDVPRQCIFAGTTNTSTYLKDETGARRFWPVKTGVIDIVALARDRDQLWAEATARFREDKSAWWLSSKLLVDLAAEETAKRYEGDPWDAQIAAWVSGDAVAHGGTSVEPLESVSVEELLRDCLRKHVSLWTLNDKMRIGRALTAMRWDRRREPTGPRAYRYHRPVPPLKSGTD